MPPVERFAKTPQAWEALSHPHVIGRKAYALLLMANGRRSMRELSRLLDHDVTELAHELQGQGFLHKIAIGEDEPTGATG
ncbi:MULTISPECIES: hypothetical protein [Hydrogenophaga]|uniref:HTH marR-type domain-containing protein n=1 Tax=Hydrogenophaga electricum TaxID=1230953 RepID=A0ABQ6C4Z2_9BURK|nr:MULTISPECIES: hypothetical protein [Hydrogenophaga]GLS14985.1 hypothetical protein GCM10007935_24180 [Hydrogenophaga electricum]